MKTREELDARLDELLDGKRVCFCGPASTIDENPDGFVDAFDVVIRCNHEIVWESRHDAARGSRTDILMCGTKGSYLIKLMWKRFDPKALKCLVHSCPPEGANYSDQVWQWLDGFEYHYPYLVDLIKETRRTMFATTFPNTGMVAWHEILKRPVKQLHITGVTFHMTPYFEGHAPGATGDDKGVKPFEQCHNPFTQIVYFRDKLWPEPRITVDGALDHLLNSVKGL